MSQYEAIMSVEGERYTYTKRDLVAADHVAGWGDAFGLPHPELEEISRGINDTLYDEAFESVQTELDRIMDARYLPDSWHTLSFTLPTTDDDPERVALAWNSLLVEGTNTLAVIHNQVLPDATGVAAKVMRTSMWVLDEVYGGRLGISYRYSEIYQEDDDEWEWPDNAPRIEAADEAVTFYLNGKRPSVPQEFMPNDDDDYVKTLGHIEVLNGLAEVLKFCTGGTHDEGVRGCITERGN